MQDRKEGRRPRKPVPTAVLVIFDLLLLGIALTVYALFHHVLPRELEPERGTIVRPQSSAVDTGPIEATGGEDDADGQMTDAPKESASPEPTGHEGAGTAGPTAAHADTPRPRTMTERTVPEEGTAAPDATPVVTPTPTAEMPVDGDYTSDDPVKPVLTWELRTEAPATLPAGTATPAADGTADPGRPDAQGEAHVRQTPGTPDATPMPAPGPTATEEPLAVGDFSRINAGCFTDEGVIETATEEACSYRSPDVSVTASRGRGTFDGDNVNYCVMDIYIRDITCLRSEAASGSFSKSSRKHTTAIAESVGAICAINGDYYSHRRSGPVLRNGELYRSSDFEDICVLFWDGTMETYEKGAYEMDALLAESPYQIWSFGPELLDRNGQAKESYNSRVDGTNPRTAIGYFAPGHYCFVTVEGRVRDSRGLTLRGLSELMESLGCLRAYNLDGGQTTEMSWRGEMFNRPYHGGRHCSDIICIIDPSQNDNAELSD